ncbi:protein phosphatase 1 regulatory subunit 3G-like isoform X2 [Pelmatolapia mariae]|uniref:protein phosphatase 1 regulatory subunit 3G-like isoform X2 n=1 Tax=Pelmatolapia mariae TaxID=158779 RepID=UPI002FE568FC
MEEQEEEQEEEEDLDDELDASQLERFLKDGRRAKSLPACPGGARGAEEGRKRVKFADSLGLSLARVKHFNSLEEPQIPSKVLSRHKSFPLEQQDLLSGLCHSFAAGLPADRPLACLPELRDTEQRVRRLRVCLERLAATQLDVQGHVRVLSGCATGKEVGVRYTFNDWLSHMDAQAVPVAVDEQGLVGERFTFTVYTPPLADPGSAVHLAVYLKCEEGEFWDNNEGQNYTVRYR